MQLCLTFQVFEDFLEILDMSTIQHSRHVDKLFDGWELLNMSSASPQLEDTWT